MSATPRAYALARQAGELPTFNMERVALVLGLKELERELADARESKDRISKRAEAIRCELVAMERQRDRLAEALGRIANEDGRPMSMKVASSGSIASEALAAVKGGEG